MPLFVIALTVLCLLVAAGYIQDVIAELRLPVLTPGRQPRNTPFVSVLIPARDEAQRIPGCIAGLARQTYPRFELIVADDHSSDDTSAVVERYHAQLPALHVLQVAALPHGWAGKCWACWQAAQRARGEWLLFLDADVLPQPDLVAALVAHAEQRTLDLLTLMPLLRLGSLAERVVMPAFIALLYQVYPLKAVSDQRSPIAFANGPCLLIRRKVYFATGGHQSVRGSILEDADFGRHVKQSGYRIAAASAPDLIEARMYTGWASLSEGLGKNAVAGYRSGGNRSGLGRRAPIAASLSTRKSACERRAVRARPASCADRPGAAAPRRAAGAAGAGVLGLAGAAALPDRANLGRAVSDRHGGVFLPGGARAPAAPARPRRDMERAQVFVRYACAEAPNSPQSTRRARRPGDRSRD